MKLKDAMETLGTTHDENGRDAVHVAVMSVEAACDMSPGTHVVVGKDGRARPGSTGSVGIADPFIRGAISRGKRFWLFLYPRTITGLRHVWSHPAFPDFGDSQDVFMDDEAKAEAWLRSYAAEIDEGFETLMNAAKRYIRTGEYFYGAPDDWGVTGKFGGETLNQEFWDHFVAYTGLDVPEKDRQSFFTCSC